MLKFNKADLSKKASLKTEQTAALSETELNFIVGGADRMINPQPLPPRHGGSTDPRLFS